MNLIFTVSIQAYQKSDSNRVLRGVKPYGLDFGEMATGVG